MTSSNATDDSDPELWDRLSEAAHAGPGTWESLEEAVQHERLKGVRDEILAIEDILAAAHGDPSIVAVLYPFREAIEMYLRGD